MLFLVIIGLLLFSAFLSGRHYKAQEKRGVEEESNGWDNLKTFIVSVSVILFIVSFVVSAVQWTFQVRDFEDVKKFQNIGAIYHTKAEMLTVQFAKYLSKEYPEHEKNIFDKISPDKVYLYFVKFPELRASDTLTALVKRINELQSDVYAQQIKKEEVLKYTRFRLRNPWFYRFMIPKK